MYPGAKILMTFGIKISAKTTMMNVIKNKIKDIFPANMLAAFFSF